MWDTAGILFDHKKGNSGICNTWTNPREYFSGYTPEREEKTIISTSWKKSKNATSGESGSVVIKYWGKQRYWLKGINFQLYINKPWGLITTYNNSS